MPDGISLEGGDRARAMRPGYLPTLDGWRAIAITTVCIAHSQLATGPLRALNFLHDFPEFGVDLFFAISGILICSRLLDEESKTGRISLATFYIRRVFRILPAAYLYLFVIAILSFVRIVPTDWHGWWAAVLSYRNYFGARWSDTVTNRLTGHFWSLSIEEQFYLVFPSLLVFFPRHRKLCLGVLLAAAFLWLAIYVSTTPLDLRDPAWSRRTDLRIWCLIFPALLAVLLREANVRRVFARLATPYLIYGALAIEVVYRVVRLAGKLATHTPYGGTPSPVSAVPHYDTQFNLFYMLVVPLAMPIFVLATMLHPQSYASRVLEWKPLRAVGRISYGIYLWQQIYFSADMEPGWPLENVARPALGALVIAAILLSYFFLEKPLIRFGHRLAARRAMHGVGHS